ncbi:hypothetical protein P4256_10275 [Bacillus wiedmannii]|uniref:hypothetical protein n=1 Tax=Bacillus wiedmannii TaxID=1890302 RepID=UPI002E22B825|nr:hypothetical protein [Bacillus wiedmannii]
MVHLGIDYANFQGDKQTFVYVDKIFKETLQVAELTHTSIILSEDTLKAGVHIQVQRFNLKMMIQKVKY